MLYKKKTENAISRKNFIFPLAIELRKAQFQGKTAQLVAVLLLLFNNSLNKIRLLMEAKSESKVKLM